MLLFTENNVYLGDYPDQETADIVLRIAKKFPDLIRAMQHIDGRQVLYPNTKGYCKSGNKWKVQVKHNGIFTTIICSIETEDLARRVFLLAKKEHWMALHVKKKLRAIRQLRLSAAYVMLFGIAFDTFDTGLTWISCPTITHDYDC